VDPAVRHLLRNLGEPSALEKNALAAGFLRARGLDASDRAAAMPAIEAWVTDAIAAVGRSRARRAALREAILTRCDIEGAAHDAVARELHLSRRAFYYERNHALGALHRALEALVPARAGVPARVEVVDTLTATLAHARSLEHNGQSARAASLLERAAREGNDDLHFDTWLRLARIYVDAESFDDAREVFDAARASLDTRSDVARRARYDVAFARYTEATGDVDAAERLAAGASVQLRRALNGGADSSVVDALVDGLTLRSEIGFGMGRLDGAAGFAGEALALASSRPALDARGAIAARTAGAMAGLFVANDARRATDDLWAAYAMATAAGLTREAMVVVTHIAGCLRLIRRPEESVRLLTPLLDAARTVAPGGMLAAFLCELLAANLESGAYAVAASYVLELRECAKASGYMCAHADLAAAKIHLGAHNYRPAAGNAEAALDGFSRLGKHRLAGAALRLQAEALAGLGERSRAIATIRESIERLEGLSHPLRLAAAYDLLGTLSNESRHLATARKLARSFPVGDRVGAALRLV
jgi:tetratricopeptide (TPR) repeat protein